MDWSAWCLVSTTANCCGTTAYCIVMVVLITACQSQVYRPPFDEFEIQAIEVPAGQRVTIPTNQGPLLMLVQQGSGSAKAVAPIKADHLQEQVELHRGKTQQPLVPLKCDCWCLSVCVQAVVCCVRFMHWLQHIRPYDFCHHKLFAPLQVDFASTCKCGCTKSLSACAHVSVRPTA